MAKILCVTLDAEVRQSLETLSEERPSFDVTFATSPSETFIWANSVSYDVYILDARILGECSANLYSTVHKPGDHAMVICVSPQESDGQKALHAGADLFVSVPSEISRIRPAIVEFVDSRSS